MTVDKILKSYTSEVLQCFALIMEEDGVNQTELARRMGCARANVSALFKTENIRAETIAKMAAALDVVPSFDLHTVEE